MRAEADPALAWHALAQDPPRAWGAPPAGGEIRFGAFGFTQTLLANPIDVVGRQHLTLRERTALLRSGK